MFIKRVFCCGIYDVRLEPILTKKLLKFSAKDFLFVIVTPFYVKELGEVLAFAFKVAIDFIKFQFFLTFVKDF